MITYKMVKMTEEHLCTYFFVHCEERLGNGNHSKKTWRGRCIRFGFEIRQPIAFTGKVSIVASELEAAWHPEVRQSSK